MVACSSKLNFARLSSFVNKEAKANCPSYHQQSSICQEYQAERNRENARNSLRDEVIKSADKTNNKNVFKRYFNESKPDLCEEKSVLPFTPTDKVSRNNSANFKTPSVSPNSENSSIDSKTSFPENSAISENSDSDIENSRSSTLEGIENTTQDITQDSSQILTCFNLYVNNMFNLMSSAVMSISSMSEESNKYINKLFSCIKKDENKRRAEKELEEIKNSVLPNLNCVDLEEDVIVSLMSRFTESVIKFVGILLEDLADTVAIDKEKMQDLLSCSLMIASLYIFLGETSKEIENKVTFKRRIPTIINIIGVVVGIALMFTPIGLPSLAVGALMIVVGYTLSHPFIKKGETDIKKAKLLSKQEMPRFKIENGQIIRITDKPSSKNFHNLVDNVLNTTDLSFANRVVNQIKTRFNKKFEGQQIQKLIDTMNIFYDTPITVTKSSKPIKMDTETNEKFNFWKSKSFLDQKLSVRMLLEDLAKKKYPDSPKEKINNLFDSLKNYAEKCTIESADKLGNEFINELYELLPDSLKDDDKKYIAAIVISHCLETNTEVLSLIAYALADSSSDSANFGISKALGLVLSSLSLGINIVVNSVIGFFTFCFTTEAVRFLRICLRRFISFVKRQRRPAPDGFSNQLSAA